MRKTLLFLLMLFATVPAFAGGPWFVDAVNGSDSNNCLAAGVGNACLTIAHAESLSSAGDTINLAAGTYRLSTALNSTAGQLVMKANQTLVGPACTPTVGPTQCTAILSGSVKFTSGQINGPDGFGNFFVTGQTQHGQVGTNGCDTGWAGCIYPEDLFVNGTPYQHMNLGSEATLAANTWWFDYTNHIIYLPSLLTAAFVGSNTVETSVLGNPFNNNGVNGVVLNQITFEEFASVENAGAVGPWYGAGTASTTTGLNWTIENSYFTLNHYGGVQVAFGTQVLNNVMTNNGGLGIGGGSNNNGATPTNTVVQGNTVTSNNYAHTSPGFGAGGVKFGNMNGMTVRGNLVQNNIGNGIHFDTNSVNPLIDGNTVSGNVDVAATGGSGSSIICEISELDCIVRNNIVSFIGIGGAFGIVSSTSGGMNAYCNVITEGTGILNPAWEVVAGNRGTNLNQPNLGAQVVSIQNYFHHNTVIWNTGTGNVGYVLIDTAGQPNFFSKNTPPDFNMYHAPSTGVLQFVYDNNSSGSNTAKTFANYQAAGGDVHGTIDTVNTSGSPTVSITSPSDQGNYNNSVVIQATASDGSGIASATLFADWASVQTISGAGPFTFNAVSSLAQGQHTFAVMALANSGVQTCNAVTLTNTTNTSVPPAPVLALTYKIMNPTKGK